jgi:hypothetical protein
MNAWVLVLYIHATGPVGAIAEFGADKAACEAAAASYNAGHDISVQAFVCVQQYVPAVTGPYPRGTQPTKPASPPASLCDGKTAEECFYYGVAAGEGLPQ